MLHDVVTLADLFARVPVLDIAHSRAHARRDFERVALLEPVLAAAKARYLAAVPHG